MSQINYQALREAAEKAGKDKWQAKKINGEFFVIRHGSYTRQYGYTTYQPIAEIDDRPVRDFVALANPATVLALLDELESMTAKRDLWYEKIQDLEAVNKASEKRIADLSKAASVNSQWKPDVCPITGRPFFMWIEHPALGYVPTYGGPFDSYTIPTKDSDGEFSCERYDHDFGGWKGSECLGLYLIDDDEQCRVHDLEQRITELERYHTAFAEWHDKTEWVQSDKRFGIIKPWGKHRADVLKEYIELLEAQITDTTAQLANAESKCRELATENAGLKAMCEDRRMFIMNGVQLGYIKVPTEDADPALGTILLAISPQEPTPATDAFLAEVRAQGVEMLLASLPPHYTARADIEKFAAQLRKGAAL